MICSLYCTLLEGVSHPILSFKYPLEQGYYCTFVDETHRAGDVSDYSNSILSPPEKGCIKEWKSNTGGVKDE